MRSRKFRGFKIYSSVPFLVPPFSFYMIHISLNCILFFVLLILLVFCFSKSNHEEHYIEPYIEYGPFQAEPTTPPYPKSQESVFSSLPPQSKLNSAWVYAAPFQSACSNIGKQCQKGQQFNCFLTPHNQRRCYWS